MTMAAIPTDTRNALFPNVSEAQRNAGAVTHRKTFIHVASVDDVALLDARVYLSQSTPADDFVTLHEGTQTDTEDSASSRPYGAAALNVDATVGDGTLDIVPDGLAHFGSLEPFQTGDLIRIDDGTNNETHRIGGITDNTSYLTLTLDGTTLAESYAQANTVISSVMEIASTQASVFSAGITSISGTLDTSAIRAHNKGAVDDQIIITFSSDTMFSAHGAVIGSLGTGNISSTFSPTNPGTGSHYFSIPSTAWGGTWSGGDTVTFNLHPASIPLWYRREVPAGAASLADNSLEVSITGESAG
jgi:hypothetical protein